MANNQHVGLRPFAAILPEYDAPNVKTRRDPLLGSFPLDMFQASTCSYAWQGYGILHDSNH